MESNQPAKRYPNSGALFRATERQSEKSAEFTGKGMITIDEKDVEFYIDGWVKVSKKGTKFFSLRFQVAGTKAAPKSAPGFGSQQPSQPQTPHRHEAEQHRFEY